MRLSRVVCVEELGWLDTHERLLDLELISIHARLANQDHLVVGAELWSFGCRWESRDDRAEQTDPSSATSATSALSTVSP